MRGTEINLKLQREDILQLIDAVSLRRDSWQNTANYLESDGAGDVCDYGIVEECSSAEEAQEIAAHYSDILTRLNDSLAD